LLKSKKKTWSSCTKRNCFISSGAISVLLAAKQIGVYFKYWKHADDGYLPLFAWYYYTTLFSIKNLRFKKNDAAISNIQNRMNGFDH